MSLFGEYKPDVYQMPLALTMISAFSPDARGLLECTGQSLSTAQYRALESLMGNRFGGDGKNNFNLPDLRSKAPAKCSYQMAVGGMYPGPRLEGLFVGELLLLPYELDFPESLRLCNGDLLQIAQNRVLFSLLGNRFGGDGKQTFALPDLRAAAPSKFNYYISLGGALPPPS
jgi:microcystin-dependent protein